MAMEKNNKIFFIGDSHTWFLSGDPEARIMQAAAKLDFSKWTPSPTVGSYYSDEATFLWRTGTTAYSLTLDILHETLNNNIVKPGSKIVFNFGTIDLYNGLETFNNTEIVVKKYIDLCVEFAILHKATPIFSTPLYNGYSANYDIFVELLQKESYALNIPSPLVLVGNVIPKGFELDDVYNHLNAQDSEKCLKYMLSRLLA